jgi:hypothetical protein
VEVGEPNGSIQLINALLAAKADPNVEFQARSWKRQGKSTALRVAAGPLYGQKLRSPNVTRALIAAGADVNLQGPDGETLLHIAAIRENESELLRLVIDARADVNVRTCKQETALHLAASVDTVKALIAAKVSPLTSLKEIRVCSSRSSCCNAAAAKLASSKSSVIPARPSAGPTGPHPCFMSPVKLSSLRLAYRTALHSLLQDRLCSSLVLLQPTLTGFKRLVSYNDFFNGQMLASCC